MSRRKLYMRVALLVILAATICAAIVWLPRAYTALRVYQLTGQLRETTAFPTRIRTIYQLGERGNAAEPAVDSLIVILQDDSDPHIRSSAAIALGKIGSERAAVHIQRWMSQLEGEGKKDTSHFKACEWAIARIKKG